MSRLFLDFLGPFNSFAPFQHIQPNHGVYVMDLEILIYRRCLRQRIGGFFFRALAPSLSSDRLWHAQRRTVKAQKSQRTSTGKLKRARDDGAGRQVPAWAMTRHHHPNVGGLHGSSCFLKGSVERETADTNIRQSPLKGIPQPQPKPVPNFFI